MTEELRRGSRGDGMTVDLAAKIAFLQSLTAFDHCTSRIETHMSFVFLTPHRAIKLKKPVRLPYLDHSTLERRHQSCENEVRLGRRLAPDVYEGTVPLVVTLGGLTLGGAGEVVDWLVVMRRLPEERMLPEMLARRMATDADARAVGLALAELYLRAARATWSGAEYRRRLRDAVVTAARELIARGAPRDLVEDIAQSELAGLDAHAGELDDRIASGHVVEAHGDLRPEHVCLETPPVVIDPLEFDADLRTMDSASELAFFALECERLDARWFGDAVAACCTSAIGDDLPPPIVALYRGQHALTRAVLALRHLDDAPAADHARWRSRAEDYLARAVTGLPAGFVGDLTPLRHGAG